jgi:hypothetical protein
MKQMNRVGSEICFIFALINLAEDEARGKMIYGKEVQ